MDASTPTRVRPANRRELILAAARSLFAERGYNDVSMATIADAVDVRPSALYRHFPNKEAVLGEAFAGYVRGLCDVLDDAAPRDPIAGLIDRVVDDRYAGRLWVRESRHLPAGTADPVREALLSRLDAVVAPGAVGAGVRLRSVAVLAVLLSVSVHHTELADRTLRTLLADLAGRAARGSLDVPGAAVSSGGGIRRAGTREQILAAAVDLFAERTYDGVGMDDIARTVGLAPASIYHHFTGKTEILAVLLHRGNGHLQMTLDDVLADADGHRAALVAAASSYAAFAVRHPGMVQAIVAETGGLEEPDAGLMRAAQRAYVDEWVTLSSAPDAAAGRVVVMAAITAVNDLARAPELPRGPAAEELAADYARRILGVDGDPS